MNVAIAFLRKLVGMDPEQLEASAKLRKNIEKFDEHDEKLDQILTSIENMNIAAQRKDAEFSQTVSSIRAASPVPSADTVDDYEITETFTIPR